MAETGQTGDFVGGIVGTLWSFAGMLLFYLSLNLQRETLKIQSAQWNQQRVEDIYFKLLDYYYKIEFDSGDATRKNHILDFTEAITIKLRGIQSLENYKEMCLNFFLFKKTDSTYHRLAESLCYIIVFLSKSSDENRKRLTQHLSTILNDPEKVLLFYFFLAYPYKLKAIHNQYFESGLIHSGLVNYELLRAVDPEIYPPLDLNSTKPII